MYNSNKSQKGCPEYRSFQSRNNTFCVSIVVMSSTNRSSMGIVSPFGPDTVKFLLEANVRLFNGSCVDLLADSMREELFCWACEVDGSFVSDSMFRPQNQTYSR